MSHFGITDVGAYIPKLRLPRSIIADAHAWMAPGLKGLGKGERAFCAWDEDSVTMAVEAARDCGADRNLIRSLLFASTSFPFDDLQNSSIVAAALRLPTHIGSMDVGHSQRAGTSSLIQALRGRAPALVIASERAVTKPASTQELTFGAAAVAFGLGSENVIARLVGSASLSDFFVDHFRANGSRYDYYWEERWIRDEGYLKLVPAAIKAALEDAKIGIGDTAHFALATPMRGTAEAVAKAVGFTRALADNLDGRCGYAGTAQAPLMLAALLETAAPGERIVLAGFGQGADVLVLEVTEAVTARRPDAVSRALNGGIVTDSYNRMLSAYDGIELEWGMRAEKSGKTALSEQYRSSDQTAGFVAGQCGSCGAVQFPQLQYCVVPECGAPAEGFIQHPLEDQSFEVMTYTADWLAYHPAPPLYVGFVQFDNGARLMMEMVDINADGIEVGTPLRAVFRIKEKDPQRGYHRYFWKAAPAQTKTTEEKTNG